MNKDLDVMARMIGYSQAEQASPFFGQKRYQRMRRPSRELGISLRVRQHILIAHGYPNELDDTKDKWQYAHYVY